MGIWSQQNTPKTNEVRCRFRYLSSESLLADLPEGVYTAGFTFTETLSDASTQELLWYDKLCEFRVSHSAKRVGIGYADFPSTQMLIKIV